MLSWISSTCHEQWALSLYYLFHYLLLLLSSFIIFQCCPGSPLSAMSIEHSIYKPPAMMTLSIVFLNQGQQYSLFSSAWIYDVRHFHPSTHSNPLSQHKKFIFCFSLLLLSIFWPIPMYHLSGRVWKRQWMNSLWSGSVAVKDNLCVEQLVMLFEICAWVGPPRIWLKQHNNDVIFSFWANFLLWKMTFLPTSSPLL